MYRPRYGNGAVEAHGQPINPNAAPALAPGSCSALVWTQQKPTGVGLYLIRDDPLTTPNLIHIIRGGNKLQILDESSHYTGDDVEDLHESHWWYGPIPWEVPNDQALRPADPYNINVGLCAVELLKVARCPNCDGSGAIAVQTSSRQLVTREMAMDAGIQNMEGSLYSDDEWEQQRCQWCDEKNTLLAEYAKQPND